MHDRAAEMVALCSTGRSHDWPDGLDPELQCL